jgi:hypothetical protein
VSGVMQASNPAGTAAVPSNSMVPSETGSALGAGHVAAGGLDVGNGMTTTLNRNAVVAPKVNGDALLRPARPQLRLVEDAPPYVEELSALSGQTHSLHDLDIEPTRLHPLLARALIERFSARGEVVLDPAARFGTAALEALLAGREGRAAETHPVMASVCGAKISPSDIAEVALMCQSLGMRRPVGLESFREHFSAHYDVETYRELVTLRGMLGDSQARIDNTVRAIALSLMHGPSAGYFSVAAPLGHALSTDEQHAFNVHRRQKPDYRSVLPRLLKRAAGTTRDGMPSFALRARRKTVATLINDPRRLEGVETASVDLVITEPTLPVQAVAVGDRSWLRSWFVNSPARRALSTQSWLTLMNESLLEWARVLKPNHRAVLVLGRFDGENEPETLLAEMVRQSLGRFFAVEGIVLERPRVDMVRGSRTTRAAGADEEVVGTARVLVLKRR